MSFFTVVLCIHNAHTKETAHWVAAALWLLLILGWAAFSRFGRCILKLADSPYNSRNSTKNTRIYWTLKSSTIRRLRKCFIGFMKINQIKYRCNSSNRSVKRRSMYFTPYEFCCYYNWKWNKFSLISVCKRLCGTETSRYSERTVRFSPRKLKKPRTVHFESNVRSSELRRSLRKTSHVISNNLCELKITFDDKSHLF